MKSGIIRPVAAFMLALSVPAAVSIAPFAPTAQAAGLSPRSWFGNNAPAASTPPVDKAGSKMAAKARQEAEKAQQEAERAQKKANLAASRAHDLAEAEALRAEARAKKAREAAEALKPVSSSNASSVTSTTETSATESSTTTVQSSTNAKTPETTVTTSQTTTTAKPNHSLWKPTGWFKPGDPAAGTPNESKTGLSDTTDNSTTGNATDDKKPAKDTAPWNPLTWFGNDKSANTTSPTAKKTAESDSVTAAAVADTPRGRSQDGIVAEKAQAAIVETEKGNISIELYPDQAPLTVANFAKLANEGFYGKFNMKFHRVIPGFVVQTGDPTGTGAGGSKKTVPLEVKNKLSHNAKGMVAMARGADPDSATSQFYITLAPQTVLDGKYAIFGKVVGGMDVLEKIEKDTMLYGVRIVPPDSLTRDAQPEKKHFFSSR